MSKSDWKRTQPLRIPDGWTISINKLEDLEPSGLSEEDPAWLSFSEDILQMYTCMTRKRNKQTEEQTLILDLGWYPDSDPFGCFRLVAVLNRDWEFPLLEFSSRSKAEVVEMLEKWLFQEFMPPRFIEEETFRKNHPVCRSTDPFYSEANIRYLEKKIADIKAGRAKLVEHDLIEVE